MSKYNFDVSTHIPPITDIISKNQFSSIVTPNGFGTIISLPSALLNLQSSLKIYISVNTFNKVISLINYQKYLGVAADYIDETHQPNSNIVYLTNDYLTKKLLSYVDNNKFNPVTFTDILIIDNSDFNISIWSQIANFFSSDVNLYPKLVTLKPSSCSVVSYEFEPFTYNVNVTYSSKNYPYGYIDDSLISDTLSVIDQLNNSSVIGDILVFVPDSFYGDKIIKIINTNRIISAYHTLSVENIRDILSPSKFRKVILVIDELAPLITIKTIGVVIDMMFNDKHFHISKDLANKRKNYLGRHIPGLCHRMCTTDFYQRLPYTHNQPKENYKQTLQLISAGISPLNSLIYTPKRDIALLYYLGVINDSGITEIGNFISNSLFGIRESVILWKWIKLALPLFPCLIILAMIDSYGPSYFWYPLDETEATDSEYTLILGKHRQTFFNKFVGRSDLHTFLNIWSNLMADLNGELVFDAIVRWSRDNSLNYRQLIEANSRINTSTRILKQLGYNVDIGPFNVNNVINTIRPIFAEVYLDMIMKTVSTTSIRQSYYHEATQTEYIPDLNNNINTLYIDPPPYIIAIILQYPSDKSTVHSVDVALDLDNLPENYEEKLRSITLTPSNAPIGSLYGTTELNLDDY